MKILTYESSIESATLLRDKIQDITGKRITVTQNPDNINGPFIRYGCSFNVGVPDSKHNSRDFIRLVANKFNFSRLIGANGFHTPKFTQNVTRVTFPCLIRHTLQSYDGRGIVICKNRAEFIKNWQEGSYWTPFVKTNFELRVHVLGGKVRKIYKKVREEAEDEFPIRNLRLGYRYSIRDVEAYPKIKTLVKKLQPLVNGSFYTLDVGWDAKTKQYFVFEANSGSGLSERTAEMYADYLVNEARAIV